MLETDPHERLNCGAGKEQARAVTGLVLISTEKGPDVSAEAILEAADSLGGRLRDLFARHPAWGNLVVSGKRRNTWRLGD